MTFVGDATSRSSERKGVESMLAPRRRARRSSRPPLLLDQVHRLAPRFATAAAAAALVVAVGLGGAGAASASGPASDALVAPACWSSGGCGSGASIIDYIEARAALTSDSVGAFGFDFGRLATATEAIPKPWLVPGLTQVSLAVAAFAVGWEIGTTARHIWMEVSEANVSSGYCFNEQYIYYGSSGTYAWHGTCANNSVGVGTPTRGSGSLPYNDAYAAMETQSGGSFVAKPASDCNNFSPCYTYEIPAADFWAMYPFGQTQPSGTNTVAYSGWANPATGAGITTTAPAPNSGPTSPDYQCVQAGVTMSCDAVDLNGGPVTPAEGLPPPWVTDGYADPEANNLRCQLEPSVFACPIATSDGSDWESTGGPLVSIPNCYGQPVSSCESAVNQELADAGSVVTSSFSVTAAPTYDPGIALGLVEATIAAGGTVADASDTTIETNATSPDVNCKSNADYPHTMKSTGWTKVGAKGWVTCNSDQTVSLQVQLFQCSSEPSASISALTSDCGEPIATATCQLTVLAYRPSSECPAVASEGADPNAWYMSYTSGTGVDAAYSQAIPGNTMRTPA